MGAHWLMGYGQTVVIVHGQSTHHCVYLVNNIGHIFPNVGKAYIMKGVVFSLCYIPIAIRGKIWKSNTTLANAMCYHPPEDTKEVTVVRSSTVMRTNITFVTLKELCKAIRSKLKEDVGI